MSIKILRGRSAYGVSTLLCFLISAAGIASSELATNAAYRLNSDSKPPQQEVTGACDCKDLNDLINRKYEVLAAMATLEQESAIARAGYKDPKDPTRYVDSTDRHLLDADIQNAMNAVRDPSVKNHTKNMTFSPECDSSVQGDTPCLHEAAKAGEAAYIAYCESRIGINATVAGIVKGNSNWQERTALAILLDKAHDAYDAELKYIDHQLDNLKTRCKTKNWSGQIVVSYEDKFDSQNSTPGTIQGTETIANRDFRDATITIFEGKAVGELSVGVKDTTTTTKSGQESCHGGGLKPKFSSFSSTQTSTIDRKGDFYSRPSFQITFDGAGNYKIAVTMKGGYGYSSSSYVYTYSGECGKPEPEKHSVVPKVFLDGFAVVGRGHGRPTDTKLSDSDTPVKDYAILGHSTKSKIVKIQWTLSRDSAQFIAR